jgi:hypothetical protein
LVVPARVRSLVLFDRPMRTLALAACCIAAALLRVRPLSYNATK